jgi:hypothetical protein
MFSVALQPDLGEQELTPVPNKRPKPMKSKKTSVFFFQNFFCFINRFFLLYHAE